MFLRKLTFFQIFCFGFFAGIFIAKDFSGSVWFFVASVLLIWLGFKFKMRFLILLAGVFFGAFRFFISIPDFSDAAFIGFYNGSEVSFSGVIAREVDTRSDCQNLYVDVEEPLYGTVLVKVNRYPEYEYGDEIFVSGELQEPTSFSDFSYKNYLARYTVYSVSYSPYIEKISSGNGNVFLSMMFSFKGKFEQVLNEIFPEPSASLAAGLLLGSRRGIPEDVQNDFRDVGLSHIVAISGYNITIVIALVCSLLSFMPKRRQIICSCIFVVLFTLFVGASAAVVRAAIMGLISLMAIFFGRRNFALRSMLFAAFFMNLFNPKIFIYDVGFQLSFAATFGIIYVSPILKEFFEVRLPRIYSLIPQTFSVRDS
ncbi:MAG: ComEC/Rec2 family competence protein, partial [Candidatus Gracilibacteria bacterium]